MSCKKGNISSQRAKGQVLKPHLGPICACAWCGDRQEESYSVLKCWFTPGWACSYGTGVITSSVRDIWWIALILEQTTQPVEWSIALDRLASPSSGLLHLFLRRGYHPPLPPAEQVCSPSIPSQCPPPFIHLQHCCPHKQWCAVNRKT